MSDNRPGYPLYAAINVTTRCNLDCCYCYLRPRTGLDMSPASFRRVVDDLAAHRVFYTHLSGGEPFLHPGFAEFAAYAYDQIAEVSILTNGTCLSARQARALRRIGSRHTVRVQVSLDSLDPEANRRARGCDPGLVVHTIDRLIAADALVSVAMVVTRFNAESLVATIAALADRVRLFHVMCVQPTEADPDAPFALRPDRERLGSLWADLAELAAHHGLELSLPPTFAKASYSGCARGGPCAGVFTYLVIDPDLTVRPCDMLASHYLGSLENADIEAVWNGDAARRFLAHPAPVCALH